MAMKLTEKDCSKIFVVKEYIIHKRENLFAHLHELVELARIAPILSTVLLRKISVI